MYTNAHPGQSCFNGAGLGRAAGGRRGCWGGRPGAPEPAAGTEGLIISPSLESSAPPRRPPWEAEATSRGEQQRPFVEPC